MSAIFDELRRADAFPDDWYAWLCNQAAHALLVGAPLVFLALWLGVPPVAAPAAVAAIYGIGWEWLIQNGKDWRDSAMDTAMVMSGASIFAAATLGPEPAALCWAIYAALTAFGVRRRLQ